MRVLRVQMAARRSTAYSRDASPAQPNPAHSGRRGPLARVPYPLGRDGSVSWTICPGLPLREPTPEEAEEAKKMWEALERRAGLESGTPRVPGWAPGDKATGKDPEFVRLVAERRRSGGN